MLTEKLNNCISNISSIMQSCDINKIANKIDELCSSNENWIEEFKIVYNILQMKNEPLEDLQNLNRKMFIAITEKLPNLLKEIKENFDVAMSKLS